MWIAGRCHIDEFKKRAFVHHDDGETGYRVKCLVVGRAWPIPFGTMADAQRAAELFNELCPITPDMRLAEARAMVFEAMGGSYESVRRYVVERCCRW